MKWQRIVFVLLVLAIPAYAGEPSKDQRLGKPKDYNGYFPWTPPKTLAEWEARRPILREQILVANGLWPMPEKTPLNPTIHGKIERDGYTVEKVFFASFPGHYVSGNLYRPTKQSGKLPVILCPHGHWANGRLQEQDEKQIQRDLKDGAEGTANSARFHFQAMHAQLARMGCIVFQYDMVGVADSQQIQHREGFKEVVADLRLQNFMGLQTWNSIRTLDFVLSLPNVDPTRVGITGGSGGGTQSFILSAIDDRVAASFPAVMVSTGMQGGCICENAPYLRVGTGNIEIAALTAPRPLGMTAANDWTKEIETKGLPELKALYRLYGAEDKVMAKAFLQFGHNYNQVSREVMYNFFNQHLKLGIEGTIREQPFEPVLPKDLSVYDSKHPLPSDAADAVGLKRTLTAMGEKQFHALEPKDMAGLERSRKVIGPALRTMLDPSTGPVSAWESEFDKETKQGFLHRKEHGERIPFNLMLPASGPSHRVVVWVDPIGFTNKEKWESTYGKDLSKFADDKDCIVIAVNVFRTGEDAKTKAPATNMKIGSLTYSGYYYGYNRSLVAERVNDIMAIVSKIPAVDDQATIDLVGVGEAGPWVLLARSLLGDKVGRTAVDLNGFRFESVTDFDHPMMLPGALKFGGLPGFASLIAPHELLLHNSKGAGSLNFVQSAYRASGNPERLSVREERLDPNQVVEWLLRK